MEHAQRVQRWFGNKPNKPSLNPYFNGTCSKSVITNSSTEVFTFVLILILMEHAQREDADDTQFMTPAPRLNPYFNGTCSKS